MHPQMGFDAGHLGPRSRGSVSLNLAGYAFDPAGSLPFVSQFLRAAVRSRISPSYTLSHDSRPARDGGVTAAHEVPRAESGRTPAGSPPRTGRDCRNPTGMRRPPRSSLLPQMTVVGRR